MYRTLSKLPDSKKLFEMGVSGSYLEREIIPERQCPAAKMAKQMIDNQFPCEGLEPTKQLLAHWTAS